MDKNNNLKPFKKGQISSEVAKMNGSKGGKATQEKRTIAKILQAWAEKELTNDNKIKMQSIGIDEETNKALLVLPLIKNISKGDNKALELAIQLLGEDKKKEAEIKRLEIEQQKLLTEIEKLQKEIAGEISENNITIINDIPKVSKDEQ